MGAGKGLVKALDASKAPIEVRKLNFKPDQTIDDDLEDDDDLSWMDDDGDDDDAS